ncbi:endoplasmic reticulum-Golgi intermediate compartment protein 3-like [Amphibalanus amphitrite]|uniref:endoplasmic reticulum-Golgi intermediate compartment protein 3-like n=1 Tax=Amphibalanus amphitrite TaxID=1232801 RepID=UPI001C902D3B|nr:endoplasmic reticulum-Golgi intermediate compartment protein 3-like [Amphibalanus amphitrite]XP_043197873.1 endoplasmic reticulum-Golgi intermediate compartment protein 3-like [Amphibalanus amphitrite]XP_043197874.1 endoplasmic reticulum-Golgi intermediate compartment protein 3-like [Amphibalanus amphitrite]
MSVKSFLDKLRNFDAYPKPLEDFRIKTCGGASVTLISGIIILLLFISEVRDFMAVEQDEELLVDTTRGEKLKINVDVIFHNIGCNYVSIDAMDSSGESQVNVEHNIFKRKLDLEGKPIEDPEKEHKLGSAAAQKANTTTDVAVAKKDECLSCYGAETDERKCCNTCMEVRDAYMKKGWAMPSPNSIDQCKGLKLNDADLKALQEGCQIYGYLEVNRVGGNFHISPGRSYQHGHIHVHDMQPFSAREFNLTHTIRHLSFGQNVPGRTNPLDGLQSVAEKGGTMYKYFVKIVPTMWQRRDEFTLFTNQFSVTRYHQALNEFSDGSSAPGVFFSYEFAPLMVKYTERVKSVGHFATNLCAIVGGVFTVASLLDAAIFHSVRAIQKKIELGKQG